MSEETDIYQYQINQLGMRIDALNDWNMKALDHLKAGIDMAMDTIGQESNEVDGLFDRMEALEAEVARLKRQGRTTYTTHADHTAIPSFAKERMAEIEDGDGA